MAFAVSSGVLCNARRWQRGALRASRRSSLGMALPCGHLSRQFRLQRFWTLFCQHPRASSSSSSLLLWRLRTGTPAVLPVQSLAVMFDFDGTRRPPTPESSTSAPGTPRCPPCNHWQCHSRRRCAASWSAALTSTSCFPGTPRCSPCNHWQ